MKAPCRLLTPRPRSSADGRLDALGRNRSRGHQWLSGTQWRSYHYDPVTSSISELRHQDPKGRIRFIMDQASPDHIYRSIRSIESLTAYVIPTWTIMARLLVHQTWKVSNKKRVDMPVRTNIGCTIAAVPKGHWAHGVILSDDFSDVSLLEAMTEFRGDFRSRNYMLDLHSVAEPFSMGYPLLGLNDYASLLRLAIPDVFSKPMGNEKVTIVNKLLEAHPVMAMPIYRVVYKANMLDESTMFIDPCRRSAKSIVAFKVKTGTGRDFATADQKNSTVDPNDLFGIRVASANGKLRFVQLDSQDQAGSLSELLYGASTGYNTDWTSDDIIPADLMLKDFNKTEEKALCDMSAKTPVVNRLLQSPRKWHNMISDIDSKLSAFKQGSSLTTSRPIPPVLLEPSVAQESALESPHNQAPPRAGAPPADPTAPTRSAPLARTRTPPRPVLSTLVTSVLPRAVPSILSPRPPLALPRKRKTTLGIPLPPPRPSSSSPPLYFETTSTVKPKVRKVKNKLDTASTHKPSPPPPPPPQTTSRAAPKSAPRLVAKVPRNKPLQDFPISDPLSYYSILVVSPTTRFLDSSHADGVDRLLKQKRIRLARRLHPDTAKGDSELMGKINDAFDHVETLAMRLAYHRRD